MLPQVEVVSKPDSMSKHSNLALGLLREVAAHLSGRPYEAPELAEPLLG